MATASATSTTEMPAADTARMNSMSKNINPANEIATMSAEKITVRPARSTVALGGQLAILDREIPTAGLPPDRPELLPESGDDQQAVVDAQSETEDGDHIHDRGVEIHHVREGPQ